MGRLHLFTYAMSNPDCVDEGDGNSDLCFHHRTSVGVDENGRRLAHPKPIGYVILNEGKRRWLCAYCYRTHGGDY